MAELDMKRNEFLVKVKQLAQEYWPEDTASRKRSANGHEYDN